MRLPKDFDFTQSNLQDYVDCPYRFYLRYGLRLKWPALMVDEALKFEQHGQMGARFHQLVQQYEEILQREREAGPPPSPLPNWEGESEGLNRRP